MILYPEQIILDYEVCQNAIENLDSFEVNEIGLAFDVIKNVGPGGHYLRQKHTARHMRDFRYSSILRGKDDNNNPLDPRELALKEFKKISETHHPDPLPDDVLKELEIILATADKAAEGLH
jgi:trimethylamine--corrinoid protein Co-methyltransferase